MQNIIPSKQLICSLKSSAVLSFYSQTKQLLPDIIDESTQLILKSQETIPKLVSSIKLSKIEIQSMYAGIDNVQNSLKKMIQTLEFINKLHDLQKDNILQLEKKM